MKNTYILLRNNKESNSLSIEELQEIGLKKTDLIWVECQSMAWRSPLEISELKNLVSASNVENKKNSTEKLVVKELPKGEDRPKKPGGGKPLAEAEIKNLEKYSHPERAALSGTEKKEILSTSSNGYFPGEIIEKNINNPVQKKPQNKSHFAFHLTEDLKKLAFYTGLVLAGALLVVLIQNLGSKREVILQQKMLPTEKNTSSTSMTTEGLNNSNTPANFEAPNSLAENNLITPKKEQKKPVTSKNNDKPITDANSDSQDISNNNGDKNVKPPVTENKAKPVTIEDISSKIALKASDYKVGLLGGIRNLTMTLQNDSRYLLDKVTVELRYLNQNDKIINTEKLYFQNVQAGNASSMEVNKTKRGVKVEYQITNIESGALTSQK